MRLKKLRNMTEGTPSVYVQQRVVLRMVKLPPHCGEVLGPESHEGRPFT